MLKDQFMNNLHSPAATNGNGKPPSILAAPTTSSESIRMELQGLAGQDLDELDLELALKALAKRSFVNFKTIKSIFTSVQLALEEQNRPVLSPPPPPSADEIAANEARELSKQQHAQRISARVKEISMTKDLIIEFQQSLYRCRGYIANTILAGVILVSHGSRLLSKSSGFLVGGASASGKSELIINAAGFLPPEVVITATSFSENALFYLGDIRHKYFVGGELKLPEPGEDDPYQQALRQLISDNKIVRCIVEKNERGELVNVLKETQGPATFTLTTTAESNSFNDEFINRLSVVHTDDSEEMTAQILQEQAHRAAEQISAEQQQEIDDEVAAWQEYHRNLQPRKVAIPFAKSIVPTTNTVTMRRTYPMLLNYVRIFAILHQADRTIDENGSICATLQDYINAFNLVTQIAPRVSDVVSDKALVIRDKLKAYFGEEQFTRSEAQQLLKLSEPATQRFLRALSRSGCISSSGDRGKSFKYQIEDVSPEKLDFGFIKPDLVTTSSEGGDEVFGGPVGILEPRHLVTPGGAVGEKQIPTEMYL